VAVGGDAAAGVDFHPALVEAFQQVGVAVALRRRVVQRGQLDFEAFVAGLQHQRRPVLGGQFGRRQRALVEPHGADTSGAR
jgi:hypothetical protein